MRRVSSIVVATRVRSSSTIWRSDKMQREIRSDEKDANEGQYSYLILHGPLPVAGYQTTIKVTEDEGDGGCAVV